MLEGQTGAPEGPGPDESRVFNGKTRLVVVGVVIVLALVYLAYTAFSSNTVYYLTVDEFLAGEANVDGNSVRVVGKLVHDSVQLVTGTTSSNFSITDEGLVLKATYDGVFPELFFNPHSDVVLEGRYGEEGVFQTDHIVVKCPSKFRALREEA